MIEELTLRMDSLLPLRDVVFRTLREAILEGKLKPGDRLMEIQLSNKLGVSRTPIREAIRMLEKEGLVIIIPRKGAQVAKMSEKDMEDVLEIREVLDELAVQAACDRITDEELVAIKEAKERFEIAVKKADTNAIAESDVAFHEVIYKAAKNPKLVYILSNLREQMYRYRLEYIKDKRVYEILVEEHNALYEGLVKKDKAFLVKIMHQHLQNQISAVSKVIRENA